MSIAVWPQPDQVFPDANDVLITSVGATVDESEYISEAIDAGYLLTWDPLLVNMPDDRTTVVVPVAPFETIGAGVSVWPQEGREYPDAAGDPITSIGAMVDESEYIMAAIDAGYLLTWDPLSVYQPDDRTDAGGGASAPLAAQYLVLSADGTLTDERVLTAGSNISFVDGGPGGTLTVNVTGGGDVTGPVSAVDNHIAVFSGTTGKIIKNSAAVVDGSGNVAAAGLTLSGNVTLSTPGATVDGVDLTALDAEVDTKVTGPALAVDESVARFDGITGKLVQGSPLVITDAGAATGLTALTVAGNITVSGTVDGVDVSALATGSYLTLGSDPALANERVLTAGAGVAFTDAGAGSTLTVAKLTPVNAMTTSAYTLVLADAEKILPITDGAGVVLTIPPNASVAFPIGTTVYFRQNSAGAITLTPGVGVVLTTPTGKSAVTAGQSSVAKIVKVGANQWAATGDLTETTSYLTLGTATNLANERVLTAGAGVLATDGGAGSTWSFATNTPVNALTTSTYTLVLADAQKVVPITDAAGVVLNIPANASVAFPIGTEIYVRQNSTGAITLTPAGGVQLLSPAGKGTTTAGQYAVVKLLKTGTDQWSSTGDLTETNTYLTLSTATSLANERVFTAGTGIQVSDAGAGGAYTVSSTGNGAQNLQLGTTYTLVLADAGKTVNISNVSASTLTVPTNAVVAFPLGTEIFVFQGAAGAISVSGAGVTFLTPTGKTATTAGLYATIRLVKLDTNSWSLEGELVDGATYVTLSTTTAYPNERVLTAGTNVSFVDGGAGSTLTINVAGAGVSGTQAAIATSGPGQAIAAATNTTVTLGTEVSDVGGNFAASAYTVPATGLYQVNLNVSVPSAALTGTLFLGMAGVATDHNGNLSPAHGGALTADISRLLSLTAGQVLTIIVHIAVASTITGAQFSAHRVA